MLFISKMKSIFSPNLPPFIFSKIPTLSPNLHTSSQTLVCPRPKSLSINHKFGILRKGYSTRSEMESVKSACGEIHVIVGPMFAGKTTALLRRIQSESENGRTVAIIKSDKDTRYGLDSVVTHNGEKLPCWAVSDLLSFKQKFGSDAYDKVDVIGIDEAQFFEDLYEFCCKAADHDGKTVIVAGLDGDYLRRRFGTVLDIVPLADSVTKLTARCDLCGKRAFFTLRKTGDTETELIGGADVYMPVCRRHYVNGQVVLEATRTVLESQKVKHESYVEVEVTQST